MEKLGESISSLNLPRILIQSASGYSLIALSAWLIQMNSEDFCFSDFPDHGKGRLDLYTNFAGSSLTTSYHPTRTLIGANHHAFCTSTKSLPPPFHWPCCRLPTSPVYTHFDIVVGAIVRVWMARTGQEREREQGKTDLVDDKLRSWCSPKKYW